MKRNDLTTADNLVIGDRFYKAGDKTKKVFKVVDFPTSSQVPIAPAETLPQYVLSRTTGIKKETRVVFLRHEIEIC